TEMTVHLNLFSLIDHFLDVLLSDTDEGSLHSFFTAVAVELRWDPVIKFNIKSLQQKLQKALGGMSLFQKGGNRSHLFQIFLHPADHCFLCERHKLDNKTAGLLHCIISFHQHSQAYRRRYLLAGSKVISKILCDLTGLEDCLSHIRLLHANIFDHIHKTYSYEIGRAHV